MGYNKINMQEVKQRPQNIARDNNNINKHRNNKMSIFPEGSWEGGGSWRKHPAS